MLIRTLVKKNTATFKQNSYIFIHENVFEDEMAEHLSRPQWHWDGRMIKLVTVVWRGKRNEKINFTKPQQSIMKIK